uniref:hypothetical protein n=1 Tax=Parerythrobacter lutipelagi TaxID=1964208 RepID=UPI001F015126|nr:hypothetical protein [Parerythrobacter lutipelagi]
MKKFVFIGAAAIAMTSGLVLAEEQPESLLPPGFDDPAPAPSPAPAPRTTATPATPAVPSGGGAVVQPIPSAPSAPIGPAPNLPSGFPTVEELEGLEGEELDELLGLKPRYDIPPAARRSMERVGVLAKDEGGFPAASLAKQPAGLVRAALAGTKGPVVSRWGHILLRRALASRLETPAGMAPAEFAALRATALNNLGEFGVARSLVQDVDTGNWNPALTDAAIDAYIGSSDIAGVCPSVQLQGGKREDSQWKLLQGICYAYAGQTVRSNAVLNRLAPEGPVERIDILLAQRYAGAAGGGRRAVNLEWDNVEEITPWRHALALAVGAELPDNLADSSDPYFQRTIAVAPMLTPAERADGAERAAREGILSAQAMVDLFSQIHAEQGVDGPHRVAAARLRDAYVANDAMVRAEAIREIWGGAEADPFGRYVLTAYASARLEPSEDLLEGAEDLIASMLSAGLDANAMRWASVVPDGSLAWGQLALAQPNRTNPVTEGQIESFRSNDESSGQIKSQFLVAGLAGLGRVSPAVRDEIADELGFSLSSETRWAQLIDRAAEVRNPVLVAYLAGVGMQGEGWSKMTPRHLYHIVSALNRAGMQAEARMIAAEAVARG